MGYLNRLTEIFKAMMNDGPDGALQRFRVASQGMEGSERPSRKVIEAVAASPNKERLRVRSDVEAFTAQLGDGWYYYLVGGGVAAFETGGPFPDRASLLRKLGIDA